ncbi:MAG: pilus assembly protein [Beijerinckiaceae bacterium]|nr:pilus assembly protein [Beijerinckiaceae bacterium]
MRMHNTHAREASPAKRQISSRFFGGADDATGGSAAVELGFVAPILLLMMVSTVDFGMGFYRKMQVEQAAQAGAQYAMSNTFDPDSIKAAVKSATSFPIDDATPAPSRFCGCATSTGVTKAADYDSPCPPPPCSHGTSAGTYVTVSAQGTYKTILPYTILPYPKIPASFAFKAKATVRTQ